ncbi:MAG: OmpA family protein [Bacteriovorax sp.]|jgi:outer membrane protein OmpA-like peptidoglycan-associated protein
MKKISKTILALIGLSIINHSYAYDLTKKFGLGAGVSYPIPVWGNNFNTTADPEWGASVHGRYHFDPSIGLDLSISEAGFKKTAQKFENLNLLGLWRMAGANDLSPVFGLGAGLTRIKNYAPKSLKLAFLARAGAEYGISPALSFGALLDYQYVSKMMGKMPTNPAHVLAPQLALTWYFGGGEKAEAAPTQEKVTDVVSTARSATAREAAKPDVIVEFDFEKAVILPKYFDRIKSVANRMIKSNNLTGYIEGHADSTGPASFNDKLSLMRAEAVKRKLIEYGVDQKRLRAEGFGEDRPVASNTTSEGRQRNRRAAAYISVMTRLSDAM